MIKQTFSVFTLLFVSLLATAQGLSKVEVGFPNTLQNRATHTQILDFKDGNLLALEEKGKGILNLYPDNKVVIYDKNLKPIKEHTIALPTDRSDILKIFSVDGEIIVFYRTRDKQNDAVSIFVTTLDKKFQLDKKNTRSVFKEDNINNFRERGTVSVQLSTDSLQFLVTSIDTGKKQETSSVNFIALDFDLEETANVRVEFPYINKDFSFRQSTIDGDGNIHMIASVNFNPNNSKSVSQLKVYSYYVSDDTLVEVNVFDENRAETKDFYISQIKFFNNAAGEIVCTGFFSDKKQLATKGIFTFKIDPIDRGFSDFTKQKFTDEFIKEFLSDKKAKKVDKGSDKYDNLLSFYIRDILVKEDGGFYLIAEQYAMVARTTQYGTTYTYFHGDAFVANINYDGNVSWFSRVPKRQSSAKSPSASNCGIASFVGVEDKLYLVFNDAKKTSTVPYPKKAKIVNPDAQVAVPVLVSYSNDGDFVKTPIANRVNLKYNLTPRSTFVKDGNTAYIFTSRGKGYQFIKADLK
ncbi:MAG: hypothetical protein ACXITV_04660 [Luteibaculaceae bacterium]